MKIYLFPGGLACKLIHFLPVFCITSSIYSLVAMSFERLRAIVYHKKISMTLWHAKLLCVGTWIFALCVTIPTLVEYRVYEIQRLSEAPVTLPDVKTVSLKENVSRSPEVMVMVNCGSEGINHSFIFFNGIFLLCVSYVIPMMIMTVNYSFLAKYVLQQSKKVL